MDKASLNRYLKISEPIYFYLFVLINTLPVLAFKYFTTVDGAPHVYNSQLILEMLKGPGPLDEFLVFNQVSPNWLSHILLVGLSYLCPAIVAEKILLLIYLVVFPIGFRKLIKEINHGNPRLAWFVFPFTYSYLFVFGFYNFVLGIALLFWILYFWIKFKDHFTIKRSFIMLVLVSILGITHLFVFLIFLLVIGIIEFRTILLTFDKTFKNNTHLFRNIYLKLIPLAPALILTITFMTRVKEYNAISGYYPLRILLRMIKKVQPAIAREYLLEDASTQWIFYSFLIVGLFLLIDAVRKANKEKLKESIITFFKTERNIWIFATAILLLAYFTVPDYKSQSYGFLTHRILNFVFLLAIVWLSTRKTPFWLNLIVFIMINYASISMLVIYYNSTNNFNQNVLDIEEAAAYIDPYSTILPVTTDRAWLFTHFSNYLGYDKPMVILENYEATKYYFPLSWNKEQIPNLKAGSSFFTEECFTWTKNPDNPSRVIDYIFVFGKMQNFGNIKCDTIVQEAIEEEYTLIFQNQKNNIFLYKYSNGFNATE